jgi:NADP-dependent 3-hydroxy acid dehydrogenase YdfG
MEVGRRRQPDGRLPLRAGSVCLDAGADAARRADINNGSISACARPTRPVYRDQHGITGLTKSISLDGRKYDIACSQIDIGNAATEMAAKMAKGVPQANGEIAVEPLIDVDHVARAVVYMAGLPLETNVQFMTVMATKMPFIGRG